ncbi:MAG: SPFH domain-containing protein [Candidatus Limnocylindrales bacterium]
MPLLHVVKYDGPPAASGGEELWLVWKYPSESIPLGSQLVVVPGQEVILVKEGNLGDRFGPGTHTLSTKNIPVLQKLVNLPFGGGTPFTAEVYFVNRVAKLDMKWGTADPIRVKDPTYELIVPVRAYGQFGMRIDDAAAFVLQLVGVLHPDEVTMTDRVAHYFRGAIISKVKDVIADVIVNRGVSVLELPAHLEEIGEVCRERISGELERFGLEVLNFFVESISVPEDDSSVTALRKALASKATTLIDAEAKKAAKVMEAEAQVAEIDMLGDERYRMKRSFDTMEKAVESKSGPGGTVVDLGIGLGAAGAIGKSMSDIASQVARPGGPQTTVRCLACGFENPSFARFCAGCGQVLESEVKPCPHCRASNTPGARFCNSCGNPLK